jgi:hypothetical protein
MVPKMVPKAGFEPKSAKKKKARKLRVYGLSAGRSDGT